MTSQTNSKLPIYPLLLVVIILAAYSQIFSCGFIEAYDDGAFITANPVVLQGVTWYGIKWSLTTFVTGNWHPVTWWSHLLDVTLFGLNPMGHHAVNLLLHCLNTLFLYAFLKIVTGYNGRSFLVAALFAVHPLHVESVAWIAERKDLLSTLFGLAALHCYRLYVQMKQKQMFIAMFLFFCCSLMSKPMLVTFPLLLLVLDCWPFMRCKSASFSSLVMEKVPLLFLSLVLSVVTIIAQNSVGSLAQRPFLDRVASVFNAYCVYLSKIFLPVNLCSFYPYSQTSLFSALLALLFLVSITAWCVKSRIEWLMVGWIWFLLLLMPVVGLIGVGGQGYADRYTYFPAVGIFTIIVWGGAELFVKRWKALHARQFSAVFLITVCSILTWSQVGYWRDGFTLYGRELEVVKDNWHAHFNLGSMLVERSRYDEAIQQYRQTLRATTEHTPQIYYNLGVAFERKGDVSQALDYFRSTIRLQPSLDKGYLGVARVLSSMKDDNGAYMVIHEGKQHATDKGMLLAKEAYLLHKSGKIEAAISAYKESIVSEPDFVQNYYNLGVLLKEQGRNGDFEVLVNRLRLVNKSAAVDLQRGSL